MQRSENLLGTIAAEDLHVVYCEDEDRLFFKEYKSQTSAKRVCTHRNKAEPGKWKWTTRQKIRHGDRRDRLHVQHAERNSEARPYSEEPPRNQLRSSVRELSHDVI